MLHHPHLRYDDIDHLLSELDHERRYRESTEWTNAELERSITELNAQLQELDVSNRTADDNEWKVRFENQTSLNKQMQDHKDFLEAELVEIRRRLATGSYPEAMNFNVDALNEPELLRLVKHLERMRNDYYATLRDTEWKLDKESKEFHHFDEMRRAYRADLKHANHMVERMRANCVYDPELGHLCSSSLCSLHIRDDDIGGGSSSYNAGGAGPSSAMGGYTEGSSGGGGGGRGGHEERGGERSLERKKSQKKKGGKSAKVDKAVGAEDDRDSAGAPPTHHESPTRSKSRMEKKSHKKKKDSAPAEDERCSSSNHQSNGSRSRRESVVVQQLQKVRQESDGEGGNASDVTEADDVREKQSVASSMAETITISITKESDNPAED